jgi:hypothetical protein
MKTTHNCYPSAAWRLAPLSLCGAPTARQYLHALRAEEAAPETAVPDASDAAKRAAATSEEQLVGHTAENF